ncbi:PREDICTED: FERM and PDZ domain-containing protein 4 [Nicrophorus vespilloides]|uniref:FERM and PDZ domain-containing protein 4 n=1 Tax=Nicrophorus vespilloides TaxID=110193 RepID=A0ABM1NAY1_NICVS|nr:PREDICTED: FERM and PDZ domain-containing protein 4 [Nicrophorus vespilloides]
MLLQASQQTEGAVATAPPETVRPQGGGGRDAEMKTLVLDYAPVPGWTVHVTNEGRLYYCNHVTRTAGWLPPAEAWKSDEDSLPYGWERAVDDSGRSYYVNHVNKTTTYETPVVKSSMPVEVPEPRVVVLERSPSLGFGFVAGSEKPVIVRFVTEGGPSVDKLLPGDQIISVNGEDVKLAPREHVISLVRACPSSVSLVVCQPSEQRGARKSTLLSASKRARLRSKPSRVRFAESVCVNGAPLFPPSAFSLGDLCVPPMANVLKVFLENGQTKSFKYDAWTTVQDVVESLQTKLCLNATEHFSLVVEHIKSLKRNKLTLLDPSDTLARIASRPGAHKLRCLYRIAFVPTSAASLAQQDLAALDYLFTQCCNDVIQERFAPELQYDTALKLAALHVYQHALANNMQAAKLTVKVVEKEFGLERFVPASLLEKMKRKEVRKLVAHFLKMHASMAGPGKQLTALQAKLHYLDLVNQLPSYGAKCFSAGPRADSMERVILVSPKFGISQIMGSRNSVPAPIANIEDMTKIEVRIEDELSRAVSIKLKDEGSINISLEERDANELVLVLCGYYRLATGMPLSVDKEELEVVEDLAPPYLSQHKVIPEKWSYTNQQQVKTICFASRPTYQGVSRKTNGLYNTMGRQSKLITGLDSNMNSSIVNKNHSLDIFNSRNEDDEVIKEMEKMVEDSEKYLQQEWLETSVDIESDSESPNGLHHSDSLLLLNKEAKNGRNSFTNAAIEMLRSEINCSESDTDSVYSPHNSPKHSEAVNRNVRISFGLHSPNSNGSSSETNSENLRDYLEKLKESKSDLSDLYVFEDIIDLTMLPPPATPDELDATQAPPTPINLPPITFADSIEKLNRLGVLHENLDLEEFLASVTVPPPTQKVTPAVELTPEEIMSYIIPPPPEPESNNVIEYATINRKGAFSCCSKGTKEEPALQLSPRRSSDHKPPERPPKNITVERQRSQSLTSSCRAAEFPPKLPPRDDPSHHQPPPHLFLPPKKPPLPPVPPLEVLRSRKTSAPAPKTAGIGSPHLQRSKFSGEQSTAISTPTSPYLGRGVQFSTVPIDYVNKVVGQQQQQQHTRSQSESSASGSSPFRRNGSCSSSPVRNGCMSSRENLLAKTDVAMASLLVRLDQVAAQCTAAQIHGGGRLMSEDKFQVAKEELTAQSLQLVHSSKMLVIAMSDQPNLPDLPEHLAICLTILRRLTELCSDLGNHTTAPLQTRNLILKVHDVTAAFRHLINSNIDRTSSVTIEEHLAAEAETLANVLTTLLRSLRVFSP